jgi:hypothetical protein
MRHCPRDRKDFADIVFNRGGIPKEYSGFLFKWYESDIGGDPTDVRKLLMSNESLCVKFKKMVLEVLS